jgi:hypothetical protein
MVLEGTVICVDNSEFMRNGDVQPTRMQARALRGRCAARCATPAAAVP